MFALRQRESCRPAQVGITRADQLPTISGGVEAVNQRSHAQSFFLRSKRARIKSIFRWRGSLIFGENIAAPQSPREQISWQRNGPVRLSSAHSSATLPQLIPTS